MHLDLFLSSSSIFSESPPALHLPFPYFLPLPILLMTQDLPPTSFSPTRHGYWPPLELQIDRPSLTYHHHIATWSKRCLELRRSCVHDRQRPVRLPYLDCTCCSWCFSSLASHFSHTVRAMHHIRHTYVTHRLSCCASS